MPEIIIVGGPTASGKSKFALTIAKDYDSVIINADSMQVYKEIPIITAQPDKDQSNGIPHLLYGFLSAKESCSMALWIKHATTHIDKALKDGKTPILVGGTGMYLKCLMEGMSQIPDIDNKIRNETRHLFKQVGNDEFHKMLSKKDPVMGEKLPIGDSQRMIRAWEVFEQTGQSISELQESKKLFYPQTMFKKYFINPERNILYQNCNNRLLEMIDNGAIEEVEKLAQQNLDPELPAMKALGVPELLAYNKRECSLEEAVSQAQQSTRNYAKRQVTWFKNQFSDGAVCI